MVTPAKKLYRKAQKLKIRNAVWAHLSSRSCKICGKQIGRKQGYFWDGTRRILPSTIIIAGWGLHTLDTRLAEFAVQCRYCYRQAHGQTATVYRKQTKFRVKTEIEKLKRNSAGCPFCGEIEPAALDFHHIDPAQKTGSVRSKSSVKAVREEAAKCIILCSNCHRKVHAGLLKL